MSRVKSQSSMEIKGIKGEHLLRAKAERFGIVQSGEEKVWSDPIVT